MGLVVLPANAKPRCEQIGQAVPECVKPSATDRDIVRFDTMHYALSGRPAKADAQLLLFMPGTGGKPPGPELFLQAAVDAGYRVISLAYNNDISIDSYCPTRPNPACAGRFRSMRIYGNGGFGDDTVDNPLPESIINRLVKLLQYLDRIHPNDGWGSYLANGQPNWQQIVVSGQSQGAGMAAFIAKQHAVARVILFSSPWDYVAQNGKKELAPWLTLKSRTPLERWFGGYHARENMAGLLARSYAELRIPEDHIRIFDGDLPPGTSPNAKNPFHGQGVAAPRYGKQRDFFLREPVPAQ
jgi:hypothetical protein